MELRRSERIAQNKSSGRYVKFIESLKAHQAIRQLSSDSSSSEEEVEIPIGNEGVARHLYVLFPTRGLTKQERIETNRKKYQFQIRIRLAHEVMAEIGPTLIWRDETMEATINHMADKIAVKSILARLSKERYKEYRKAALNQGYEDNPVDGILEILVKLKKKKELTDKLYFATMHPSRRREYYRRIDQKKESLYSGKPKIIYPTIVPIHHEKRGPRAFDPS